jgi:ArsR family transcriptional regulator
MDKQLAMAPLSNVSLSKADREMRVRVFKALAHASRLLIVEELAQGERCVCELTELVGADMSTVSNHLSVLRNAGVVDSDKRGQQVYYRLRMPCVLGFFSCVDKTSQEE